MPYWLDVVFKAVVAERTRRPDGPLGQVLVRMETLQASIPTAQREGSNSGHHNNAVFSFKDARFLEKQLETWDVNATHALLEDEHGKLRDYIIVTLK